MIGRFSNEYCKTKIKVVNLANDKGAGQLIEPIKTRSTKHVAAQSEGTSECMTGNLFGFHLRLVKKAVRALERSYVTIFWVIPKMALIMVKVLGKHKNNGLPRKKITKGVILKQKGTRMAEDGEDWNGLELTILKSDFSHFFQNTRTMT